MTPTSGRPRPRGRRTIGSYSIGDGLPLSLRLIERDHHPTTPRETRRESERGKTKDKKKEMETTTQPPIPPERRIKNTAMISKDCVFDDGSGASGHSAIGLKLADISLVLASSQEWLGVKDIQHLGQKYRDSPMGCFFFANRVHNYGWESIKSSPAHAQPLCGPTVV